MTVSTPAPPATGRVAPPTADCPRCGQPNELPDAPDPIEHLMPLGTGARRCPRCGGRLRAMWRGTRLLRFGFALGAVPPIAASGIAIGGAALVHDDPSTISSILPIVAAVGPIAILVLWCLARLRLPGPRPYLGWLAILATFPATLLALIPIYGAFGAVMASPLVVLCIEPSRRGTPDPRRAWACPMCRHDLRGHQGGRCAECGHDVELTWDPRAVPQRWWVAAMVGSTAVTVLAVAYAFPLWEPQEVGGLVNVQRDELIFALILFPSLIALLGVLVRPLLTRGRQWAARGLAVVCAAVLLASVLL